jgi:hypothetical protein
VKETLDRLRKRSPSATINRSPRFRPDKLNEYRSNIPAAYVEDASLINSKPVKMSSIGRAKRWSEKNEVSPGVG